MASAIDIEKFKQDMIQDVASAKSTANQTSQALGVKPDDEFNIRAIRIKNKSIGERELAELEKSFNKLGDQLVFESGLVDQIQESKFRSDLNSRMHQWKAAMLKAANELQYQMNQRKLDQKKQQAIWQAVGEAVGGATELGASQIKTPRSNAGLTASNLPSQFNLSAGIPKTSTGAPDFGVQTNFPEYGV